MSDLLATVADEFRRALGRDGDDLNAQREKALSYAKGKMDDVTSLPGRSSATSSDVADAVETALPDLVEIFTSGDDIATFSPVGPEDEDAAQQETDYVNHVFFNENDGFLILYSMFKDALLVKTGVAKWWWEEYDEPEESFEDKSLDELASAVQRFGDRVQIKSDMDSLLEGETEPTVDFVIAGAKKGRACVMAVPPEDFGVSKDTVRLSDAPYCFHRTRVRVYTLIERGVPADKVRALPAYTYHDEAMSDARAVSDEDTSDAGGDGEHRMVEVVEHYIDGPKGRKRVLTDGTADTLLESDDHPNVPFAALTPYIVPHAFFGESLADKLMMIQQIRTVLTRMLLDSGYFALNQRNQVDMTRANEWTVTDLLRNEPNVPVRTNGDAIKPLQSGGLSFDATGALEFFAVQGEQRTGIVRNAQGLNPDTLHDTAKGAMALISAAQKRLRLIARIFAETGLKDLFLGLHDTLRQNATSSAKARLRNKWVDVDPTKWGSRSDMTIDIGVGSGGKEQQLVMLQQGLEVLQGVILQQGGVSGPLVTPDNAYQMLKRFFEKGLGFKSVDAFLTDPADAEPQEPQPDPAMMEAQAKLQIAQQDTQAKQGLAEQKAMADVQLAQAKGQADIQMRQMELEAETAHKREQLQMEMQLKREQLQAELGLKREQIAAELELKRQSNIMGAMTSVATSEVAPGGEPG